MGAFFFLSSRNSNGTMPAIHRQFLALQRDIISYGFESTIFPKNVLSLCITENVK